MKVWNERSDEIANLLNPAFCCALLTVSVTGYETMDQKGMSFPLAYMVLPIILNKPIRDSLPKTISTQLIEWIQNNYQLTSSFYDQTIAMKPFTQEALLFSLRYNWLSFSKDIINSNVNRRKLRQYLNQMDGEAKECMKKSLLIGKWFASAGSPQTVMTAWRIKP